MTNIALRAPFSFSPNEEQKRFLHWALCWLILPNIGFMLLWYIGAPPRQIDIVAIGLLGLIVKRFPFWLRYGTYVATVVMTTLSFVSGLFNLSIKSLLYSLQFFAEIKPSNSLEYILVGAALVAMLVYAYFAFRKDQNFETPWLILAGAGGIVALAATDYAMGQGMRGHYKRIAPEGAYFSSGAVQSGIEARADGTRHIIVVMVESLGLPRGNAEMQRLLFAEYKNNPAIRARYDLSQGHNPYYVSTTAGEVRELCGRWGDYYDLVDRKDSNCMPARLANKGYATHAMHSFIGSFFERDQWYPNIGFQKTEFGPLLIERGARNCGGVFAGACDRDVPKQMADMLKKATKPTFLYFLTVNTHLPVPPGMNLNNEDCERLSPKLEKAFPQICRQFVMWHDFNNAMVQEIAAKDFPAADILIVGDHMPPYFDRYHRSQFDPAHVPWLYLRHKDATDAKAGDREG